MCGIAGIISADPARAREALARMTACQRHRGPDDDGHEYTTIGALTVGLGQRRLSIIDLSPAGHQPMAHPLTGDVITYNGELYNFQPLRRELEGLGVRFRGGSDTEVMLHALTRWGPEVVDRFHGMFAFAYLDRARGRLLLARDPMGIKPLYVARGAGGDLLFASEVRAILASGLIERRIDRRGLGTMLAFGAVQEPCTFFEGVTMLPPGCAQTFDLSSGSIRPGPVTKHWDFPEIDPAINQERAVEELRARLDEAVRDHLISDVPIGVFLSSGIDSTTVASLGKRHTPNLRTFTVGFGDNPDMSEGELAKGTAGALGVDHTDIQILSGDALRWASDWLASLDQPSQDGFNVYVLSKAVRSRGIVVALSGQGGDELLGGYASFGDIPVMCRAVRRAGFLPPFLRAAAFRLAAFNKSEAFRLKAGDMARTSGGLTDIYFHRRRVMSDGQLAALGVDAAGLGLHSSFMPPEALERIALVPGDDVASISRLEARHYMLSTLLRDGDTNGMAHSLEIRVPVLDRRVIDLAFAIPGRVRLPSGRADKHLMRVAFRDFLRPELLNQPKRGFFLPIARWMTGPLRPMAEAALTHLKSLGVVRPEGVDAVWSHFLRAPESQIWTRAFTLVTLGTYLKNQGVNA